MQSSYGHLDIDGPYLGSARLWQEWMRIESGDTCSGEWQVFASINSDMAAIMM